MRPKLLSLRTPACCRGDDAVMPTFHRWVVVVSCSILPNFSEASFVATDAVEVPTEAGSRRRRRSRSSAARPQAGPIPIGAEDEVLYGGGAGSGKSDALIIDALGKRRTRGAERPLRLVVSAASRRCRPPLQRGIC